MSKQGLMLLTVCLILFSFNSVLAQDFNVIAGYYYLDINPDLNKYIEKYNDYIERRISEDESWGITFTKKEIDRLDKIKNATGYYLGLSTKLSNLISNGKKEISFTTQYESFSSTKHGSLYTEWTEPGDESGITNAQINTGIKVNGLYGGVLYKLNNYLDLTGGVGYYRGQLDINGHFEITGLPREELNYDTSLKGTVGYKIGARLNYQLSEHFSLLGSVNYRSLVMELAEEIEEIEIDSPVETSISKVDLSGLEGKLGLSYRF